MVQWFANVFEYPAVSMLNVKGLYSSKTTNVFTGLFHHFAQKMKIARLLKTSANQVITQWCHTQE
jgi:hypothetical protein